MKLNMPTPLQQEHEALHAGRSDIVAFAQELAQHARTEEDVIYPAAVLVGGDVRLLLARRADQRVSG